MNDIEILHQMITDNAKVALVPNYNGKMVELTETECRDSTATIFGMPENSIIINLDRFWLPDKILTGKRGQLKRADFVIVANDNRKWIIICIELKRIKGDNKKIIKQLTGAQCFITYCQKVGQAFWNQPDFLENYEHRFISITHTSISKQRTRVKCSANIHNQPTKFLKISSPNHLQFNKIVGLPTQR